MRAVIKSVAVLGILSTAAFVAPKTAPPGAKADAPSIVASITDKQLLLKLGDSVVQTYYFASGQDKYPTPTGSFTIRKLTWNPSWTPPPDAKWAKNATGSCAFFIRGAKRKSFTSRSRFRSRYRLRLFYLGTAGNE